jgi:hypothetical protein
MKKKLTAFMKSESTMRAYGELSSQAGEIFQRSASLNGSESRGDVYGGLPRRL